MSSNRLLTICYTVVKGMPLGGGIETYTEEMGSRLAARGHRVIVYTMRHYGSQPGMYRGMEVRTLPTVQRKSSEKLVAAMLGTFAQVVRRECDILHLHAFGPAMFCGIPRLLHQKVVVQGHGLEWKRSRWSILGKTFLRLAEVPSAMFPNAVTVVSRTQQEHLRRAYGVASEFIPTGIKPPQPEQPGLIREYGLESGNYILFASRLVREKGAHFLIEAYRRLRPDVKLVIAGDAQHEQGYRRELAALAAGDPNIVFTGFVTGRLLRELFSHARLFVLPSEIEGMSIALLEAMSYGNGCLVSDIPENLDTAEGRAATFRSGDAQDLADQMAVLLRDPCRVRQLGTESREYVLANHTWDAIADRMLSFYGRVLNGRQ